MHEWRVPLELKGLKLRRLLYFVGSLPDWQRERTQRGFSERYNEELLLLMLWAVVLCLAVWGLDDDSFFLHSLLIRQEQQQPLGGRDGSSWPLPPPC